MKKFVIAALAALVCVSAAAQLKVKASASAPKTIAVLRSGTVRVVASDEGIYFTLPSTNRFDNEPSFFLGKDADSAVQTLADLVALIENGDPGSVTEAERWPGQSCTLLVDKQLGVKVLYLDYSGLAGQASTSKGELEKMSAAILKKVK
jgi:hypothetical protein